MKGNIAGLEVVRVTSPLEALHDPKRGRFCEANMVCDLLESQAAFLRSKAFQYGDDPLNCAHCD